MAQSSYVVRVVVDGGDGPQHAAALHHEDAALGVEVNQSAAVVEKGDFRRLRRLELVDVADTHLVGLSIQFSSF